MGGNSELVLAHKYPYKTGSQVQTQFLTSLFQLNG